MSSNREKILQMTAELRKAIEEVEAFKKNEQQSQRARRDAEKTLWAFRRRTLMEIEKLGGFKAAGYKTFTQFCQQEIRKVSQSVYAAELTYGYFELIFKVPCCTYNPNFFVKSGLQRGKNAFLIRKSGGEGIWVLDEEECDKARQAWEIAQGIAAEAHPKQPLPDAEDMRQAVSEVIGIRYEPRLTTMQKTLKEVERLRHRVEELESAKAIDLPFAEYVTSLKEVDRLIEIHCQNPAQQALARRMLIQESPEAAKRYVRSLIARRYQRERAA